MFLLLYIHLEGQYYHDRSFTIIHDHNHRGDEPMGQKRVAGGGPVTNINRHQR